MTHINQNQTYWTSAESTPAFNKKDILTVVERVREPIYLVKDQKNGEAHWLNPKTADSWPSGPTGTTPVKAVPQKALTNEPADDNVRFFLFFF